MPRGNWSFGLAALIAVIAALFLGVWLGNLDYSRYGAGGDYAAAQQAAEGDYDALLIDAPPANPQPRRDEWREETDLKAQRDMAKWTGGMFWAGVAGLLVTSLGVVYVALTLDATRDNVRVTRDIGQKQLRAYLHCVGASYSVSGSAVICTAVIKNSGQSPALYVASVARVRGAYVVTNAGKPDIAHIESKWLPGLVGPVEAGSTVEAIFVWPFLRGEMQKLKNSASLIVEASLAWDDVFDMRHERSFTLTEGSLHDIAKNDPEGRVGELAARNYPKDDTYPRADSKRA